MNDTDELTRELARRVLGWKTAPNRYIASDRRWLPKWRFQPTKKISDAFQLLQAGDAVDYVLRADRNGLFSAKIRTHVGSAEASASSLPLAICLAMAGIHGVGLEGHE